MHRTERRQLLCKQIRPDRRRLGAFRRSFLLFFLLRIVDRLPDQSLLFGRHVGCAHSGFQFQRLNPGSGFEFAFGV
jgi:hypothetical protein